MSRDTQKSPAYHAEFMLRSLMDNAYEAPTLDFFGSTLTLPQERKFGNVENVQAYVDRVLSLNWVRATWPTASDQVRVRERKGQHVAHYSPGSCEIAVPVLTTWALREVVVLHEIAHHLTPADPGHGPEFTGVVRALLTEIIGPEVGLVFTWLLDNHGARVDNVLVRNA